MARPRISLYEQRSTPQSAAPPYLRPTDQGGAAAEGLAGLSGGLRDLRQSRTAEMQAELQIEQERQRREADDARVYAASQMARARAEAQRIADTALREAPDGWRGAPERVSAEFGQLRDSILQQAPTATARDYLDHQLSNWQPGLLGRVAMAANVARRQWRLDTSRQAVETDAANIAADPSLYAATAAQHRELIGAMEDLNANDRRDLTAAMEGQFATSAVAGMIQRDPAAALAMLRQHGAAGPPAEEIGPQIAALFGAPMTSGRRSPAHNAAVGGVGNSMHLDGLAVDIANPPRYASMSREQIEAAVRRDLGQRFPDMRFTEVLAEGDHVHIGWRGGGSASAESAPSDGPIRHLTAQQYLVLTRQAQAAVAGARAQARAEIGTRLETATALLRAGEAAPDRPSVEDVRAARGDADAAQYAALVQSADAQSAMHHQPTAALEQMVAAAPPGPEASDAARFRHAINRDAAAAVLEQRASPVDYAVRQGRVSDTADMQAAIGEGDFAAIGRRLIGRVSAIYEMQRDQGVDGPANPPPPFTRSEASQLRAALDRLTPDDRVAALRSLRGGAALSNSVYGPMLEQIYADNAAARAGAGLIARDSGRVVQFQGGVIDAETAGRRLLAGAAALQAAAPPPEAAAPATEAPARTPARREADLNMPSNEALEGIFQSYAGDAYAGMPELRQHAFEAFRAYVAEGVAYRGINGGGLTFTSNGQGGGAPSGDPGARRLAQEALAVTVGAVRENRYGGRPGLPSRTYLPWGVSPQQFEAQLRNGWPAIRAQFPQLNRGPNEYDYVRDRGGPYRVYFRGLAVADENGAPIRVRLAPR